MSEKQKKSKIALSVVAAVLLIVCVIALIFIAKHRGAVSEDHAPAEKLTDTIAIPGFESLTLKADSKKQSIALENPKQNFCWFRISLVLEDGTVLWTSKLIAPGAKSDAIVLSEPLSKGSYNNSILKYECFNKDKDFTPLNGAETKVNLIVK